MTLLNNVELTFMLNLQTSISKSGSQPIFIALDSNRNLGITSYTNNKNEFSTYLKRAVEKYKRNYKKMTNENEIIHLKLNPKHL